MPYFALRYKREPTDTGGRIEEAGVVAGSIGPGDPRAGMGTEGVGGYEEEAGGYYAHGADETSGSFETYSIEREVG